MYGGMDDVRDIVNPVTRPFTSSKNNSSSFEANADDKDVAFSLISSTKYAILFWAGISMVCLIVYIIVCSQARGSGKAERRARTSSSSFGSGSENRSLSRTPRSRERSGGIWRKVFAKGHDEPKAWPTTRRFTSRRKSPAGDVEMQRPRLATATVCTEPAVPTLYSGTGGTRALQRPEHVRTDRDHSGNWRAEAERQRLRDAWDRLAAADLLPIIPVLPLATEPRPVSPADWPAFPEPVAQTNVGRTVDSLYPVYGVSRIAESSTSNVLDMPPPAYPRHVDGEMPYLRDYQDLPEDIRADFEPPPYVQMWTPASAPVNPPGCPPAGWI